jgi:hypothetical protein
LFPAKWPAVQNARSRPTARLEKVSANASCEVQGAVLKVFSYVAHGNQIWNLAGSTAIVRGRGAIFNSRITMPLR